MKEVIEILAKYVPAESRNDVMAEIAQLSERSADEFNRIIGYVAEQDLMEIGLDAVAGSRLGSITTPTKAVAARRNGKKGGRPKKLKSTKN